MKKYGLIILIGVLLLISSVLIYVKVNPKTLPPNLISGTGRIDGDIISLNTKYMGRVKKVLVQDGQRVKKGETIAILQSDEYRAKLEALDRNIDALKDKLTALQERYGMVKTASTLGVDKAQKAVSIAMARIKELDQKLLSLQNTVRQDKRDYERIHILFKKRLSNKQAVELSKLKLSNDTNTLLGLKQQEKQLKQNVSIAKDNVSAAQNQRQELLVLQSQINSAKNSIKASQADREVIQITINELAIKSPVNGIVLQRIAQPGEVLSPGMIVATMIDPKMLYLKMFVDTLNNGKIKLGDKAVIFLDSDPHRAIAAQVVNIAQQAEFTPKEVSVRSDRIQRVYAVHVKPLQVDPLLKLGIPAIGVISTNTQDLPSSLDQIPSI
jgi:HlyD family secretion protein